MMSENKNNIDLKILLTTVLPIVVFISGMVALVSDRNFFEVLWDFLLAVGAIIIILYVIHKVL